MLNSFRNTIKYLRFSDLALTANSTKQSKTLNIPYKLHDNHEFISKAKAIYFTPRSINLEINEKPTINKTKRDPISYTPIVNPRSILPLIDSAWKKDEIALPTIDREEKQAVRLIVIRRKKMKKHQKKKLWKRMRFRWARVKNNRKIKKERLFQSELALMVKQANEFSAEQYVTNKIQQANHVPLPTRWKHKRLPQFIIRQLLGIDKKINYKHTDVYKA
ncbi:unnamed protein product [Leptidea sinapis]|uniref:Ribosomal protein mS38 C-terminal domain-containing protein n=1 Tax=Leptidea sinapis TaxID=189913 RepID=A0A5E4QEH9_9NEOP|nr:unnamed protein product [Leptidea sinapis]